MDYPWNMNNGAPGSGSSSSCRGFTLIELFVVLSIIVVLAGITLGVSKGVSQQIALSRARGEMAALAQALDQFKLYYGDYPKVSDGGEFDLYAAMIGMRGVSMEETVVGETVQFNYFTSKSKHFVELAKFQMNLEPIADSSQPPKTLDTNFEDNYFVDPWGEPYQYSYESGDEVVNEGNTFGPTSWKKKGFVLMSLGPDKQGSSIPVDGLMDDYRSSDSVNQDNLIYGED